MEGGRSRRARRKPRAFFPCPCTSFWRRASWTMSPRRFGRSTGADTRRKGGGASARPAEARRKERRPLPDDLLKNLYVAMVRIRKAEDAVVKLYPEQELRCPT